MPHIQWRWANRHRHRSDGYIFTSRTHTRSLVRPPNSNKNKTHFAIMKCKRRTEWGKKSILSRKACKCSKVSGKLRLRHEQWKCLSPFKKPPRLSRSVSRHTLDMIFFFLPFASAFFSHSKFSPNCLSLFAVHTHTQTVCVCICMDVVWLPSDDTFSCGIWYNTHSLSGFSALVCAETQLGACTAKHIPQH